MSSEFVLGIEPVEIVLTLRACSVHGEIKAEICGRTQVILDYYAELDGGWWEISSPYDRQDVPNSFTRVIRKDAFTATDTVVDILREAIDWMKNDQAGKTWLYHRVSDLMNRR